jgi:hypothetical protein
VNHSTGVNHGTGAGDKGFMVKASLENLDYFENLKRG